MATVCFAARFARLHALAGNADGQVIGQQVIAGQAAEGSTFTQTFTLSASGAISLHPIVYLPVVIR